MSVTSAALRKLATLNLSAEQLAGVLDVLADQQETEEARLASQRDRKARQRRLSRDGHGTVTGQSGDNPTPLVPPDKETPRPLEITPPLSPRPAERERAPNPIIVLQSVVDAMTAQSFAAHCSEKRKPLSSQQAEEIVAVLKALRDAGGNPVDAVRKAIGQGWTTINAEWLANAGFPVRGAMPRAGPKPTLADAFSDLGKHLRQQDALRSGPSDDRLLEALPDLSTVSGKR